jgi:hypothetical protein
MPAGTRRPARKHCVDRSSTVRQTVAPSMSYGGCEHGALHAHLADVQKRRGAAMTVRSALVLAMVVPALACAYNPTPVAVRGAWEDVQALAGQWTGSYFGEGSGRSGSIVFTLVAGEDHAHGDVLMIPRGIRQPYRPWHPGMGPGWMPDPGEVLTIRFVAVEGGEVRGTLDRYWDPDCRCGAVTRFRGSRRGNVIQGTFRTYTDVGAGPTFGTWKVQRRRS